MDCTALCVMVRAKAAAKMQPWAVLWCETGSEQPLWRQRRPMVNLVAEARAHVAVGSASAAAGKRIWGGGDRPRWLRPARICRRWLPLLRQDLVLGASDLPLESGGVVVLRRVRGLLSMADLGS